MRPHYRITVTLDEPVYWPFWPFKLLRTSLDVRGGFKVEVDQQDAGGRMTGQPTTLTGYDSYDGFALTTVRPSTSTVVLASRR